MKKAKVGLLIVAIAAMGAIVWYQTSAFAEDHAACATAPAASGTHSHEAAAKAPAKSKAPKGDDAIIAEQKGSYPLDTCVVMGGKLGEHGAAYDYVYKGRLVRFCCKGCVATFEKDPAKYLGKIDAAAKEKTKPAAKSTTQTSSSTHNAAGHAHH